MGGRFGGDKNLLYLPAKETRWSSLLPSHYIDQATLHLIHRQMLRSKQNFEAGTRITVPNRWEVHISHSPSLLAPPPH